MKYNYLDLAKQTEPRQLELILTDRLPAALHSPVKIQTQFQVKAYGDYYLLSIKTSAALELTCQRCLDDITINYQNDLTLAICDSEDQAEQATQAFESIVSGNQFIDLVEILTDELHLYAPDRHIDDCQ